MSDKVKFIDREGNAQEVTISIEDYKAAEENGLSLREYINQKYDTAEEVGAFEQMCVSAGLYAGNDSVNGIRSPKVKSLLMGTNLDSNLPTGVTQSRVLFPAFVSSFIEDKTMEGYTSSMAAFAEMCAYTDIVPGFKVDIPKLNMDNAEQRMEYRSQLAEPKRILSITESETTVSIPEMSAAVEISDRAMNSTTLGFVAKTLEYVQKYDGAMLVGEQLLDMLQGSPDIATMNNPLDQTKANVFDTNITTAGTLTDTAFVKWLYSNVDKMSATHIVTDVNGALAIRNRAFPDNYQPKNTAIKDDGYTVQENIMFPNLVDSLKIFIVPDSVGWPANTIMAIDKDFAIHRFVSSAIAYSAVERFVLRRGNGFMVSHGTLAARMNEKAFSVLSLTV